MRIADFPHAKIYRSICGTVRGDGWLLRTILGMAVLLLLLTSSPSVLLARGKVFYHSGYDLKLADPFANMIDFYPEHTHESKLTPRILVPCLVHFFKGGRVLCQWLDHVAGVILLGVIWLFLRREAGFARSETFLAVLSVGSTFYGYTAFTHGYWHPFDGVALLFCCLAVLYHRNIALPAVFIFMALWVDERAVLALPGLCLMQCREGKFGVRIGLQFAMILLAFGAYSLCLHQMAHLLGWKFSYGGVGQQFRIFIQGFPVAFFYTHKANWMMMGGGLLLLFRERRLWLAAGLVGGQALIFLASSLTIDSSRGLAFSVTLLLFSYTLLDRPFIKRKSLLYRICVICLLTTGVSVYGNVVAWDYSLPVSFLVETFYRLN